ncbi:MAG: thiamine phosphate synthase [Betaproteobacteria bacterium]|nr:MAG: thiamine phosphate synthase [Betaproteobacteria bacterium]
MAEAGATRGLAISGLYALTPELEDTRTLARRVAAALDGGARSVQYRNKRAAATLKVSQALILRALCSDRGAVFIVNDDIELASAASADGVHLGRSDASLSVARHRLGCDALIGVSCYDSLKLAEEAVAAGADYVAFGSFFESRVKPYATRADTSLLVAAKARWSVPIVAIGGITPHNATPLLAAGADALAVISALFDASDIEGVASAARAFTSLFTAKRAVHPA